MNKESLPEQGPLGREEIARIAILLKSLPEYKETKLIDLVFPACEFLLICGDNGPIYQRYFEKSQSGKDMDWFSRSDAAKIVTGNPRRARALDQFDRYLEFVTQSAPGELFDESASHMVGYLACGTKDTGFHRWVCDALKEKFEIWRQKDSSRQQSDKAKKSQKKFLQRKSSAGGKKPRAGGAKS
jgi:hypothetical protein